MASEQTIKRMTASEAREQGIVITKVRKEHGLDPVDGKKNAQKLLTKSVGEAVASLNKIMRLADGKVNRGGSDYPVDVTEKMRQWAEDKIANMHQTCFTALESGVRPTAIMDVCPSE